jgi:hypothetical protein
MTDAAQLPSSTQPLPQGNVETLRALVASAQPADMEWIRQVCIRTRRVVHEFVIAPVDQDLMGETVKMIRQAVKAISSVVPQSPEAGERLKNIRERQQVLESLLNTVAPAAP